MRNLIIINEQHSFLIQQEQIIRKELGRELELKRIPKEGLNRQQIEILVNELNGLANTNIIVLSPIPLLLGRLAHIRGELQSRGINRIHVYIMHNDKREKVETGGVVRSIIAKDGWELIEI